MENEILNESCKVTLKRDFKCNYIITAIKDFNEMGLNPAKEAHYVDYFKYLLDTYSLLVKKATLITLVVTDRKAGGGVITIAERSVQIMRKLGFLPISYKIWEKSKVPTVTSHTNYAHVITFNRDGYPVVKNNTDEYKLDIFHMDADIVSDIGIEDKISKIPERLVEIHLKEFTEPNALIYDPYCREGTVPVCVKRLGRRYLASEEIPTFVRLTERRLRKL